MTRRNIILLVAVAAMAAGAGIAIATRSQQSTEPLQTESATVLSSPRALPEFTLERGAEADFTRADFEGQWSLVFFGFTNCPDVCPNTLFMLDQVTDRLGESAPQVVFVSVDVQRDDAEKTAVYAKYFNPDFIGLRGDGNALAPITEAMSVAWEYQPEGDSYTVIHSSAILVVNPAGDLHALFTAPHSADAIATDMQTMVDNYR
ncbi:MAG: SCO family protein [Gammaproteobacteria bacterium]|nr:SCO family protein [Gammaproteobacteria bacterium]